MKIVTCERCGKFMFSITDDGLVAIATGSNGVFYVRKIDGVCECGHGFHYSVTDRLLERIIERYNQRAEVT